MVGSQAAQTSPRREQVDFLKAQAFAPAPSVRDLLAGYDRAVDATIEELAAAHTNLERIEAADRLNAAITIHDAVVGGVLCPLLEAVAGGEALAVRLHAGCNRRAELQGAWGLLTNNVAPDDLYRLHPSEIEGILSPLIEDFRSHEMEETSQEIELLKDLSDESYRTKGSLLQDAMEPWHSEGPSVLALRMALWAGSAPAHVHPRLERHPTSRLLRSYY